MRSLKPLLLTGTVLAVFALPSGASAAGPAPAPASTAATAATPVDPVAAAEKAVEDARAALRAAMATGKNVSQAKAALNKAVAALVAAQAAAAAPPTNANGAPPAGTGTTPPAAAAGASGAGDQPPPPPPPGGSPPSAGAGVTPAVVGSPPTPPAKGQKPALGNQPPKVGKPPATTPSPTGTPPAGTGSPAPGAGGPATGITIIGHEGDRVISRDNGQVLIQHDDAVRFGKKIDEHQDQAGNTVSTILRPNGAKIVTTLDPSGNIVRRIRIMPSGVQEVLIGDTAAATGAPPPRQRLDLDFIRRLPPIAVPIPQQDYVVNSDQASQSQIEKALVAPPIERVERPYTLEEVRRSGRLRDKLRRIDIDTVNFEFGQATVPDDQINLLQVIGSALADVVARDPDQVFLIEGHTDAVGSDLANLALSDRRAESVAEILTSNFNIPPENLVTQGYGEQYLKVLTSQPERENRRVTVRNITPLLRASQ